MQVEGGLALSSDPANCWTEGGTLLHTQGSHGALSRSALQFYLQNIVLLPYVGLRGHGRATLQYQVMMPPRPLANAKGRGGSASEHGFTLAGFKRSVVLDHEIPVRL